MVQVAHSGRKSSTMLGSDLARKLIKEAFTMNRLQTIATRQRRSRARDIVFASFIALLALVGGTTVGVTIHSAITHVASR